MTMRIGTILRYGRDPRAIAGEARELESAGLDVVWIPEAYSFDAVSLLGYLAAVTERLELGSGILPVYTRTPSLTAMTAASLDALSGGRFLLGLGVSGPQVIEGWHGLAYDKPLARTREVIEICRKVWAREEPLTHDGRAYTLPLPPEQGTGLGKPLKIINHPLRARIPVWIAALGEQNVALTAEVAEGWLPVFFVPDKWEQAFGPAVAAGTAKRDPSLPPLEIAAGGLCAFTDDPDERSRLLDQARPQAALYIGGMGAVGRNFYNALVCRYGWEAEAAEIQRLYLSGKKQEAEAAVPLELLELTSLVGSEGFVKERLAVFGAAGVTLLNITPAGPDPVRTVGRLRELIG